MDIAWAIQELDGFLALARLRRPPSVPCVVDLTGYMDNAGSLQEIVASAQVVEQIFARVLPDWKTSVPGDGNEHTNRWCQHIETAQRVKAELIRQDEVREKLGDNAPSLSAGHLHPWIWDGARALWQSGHYREAVRAASVKLNSEAQNKTGRFDISEVDLFKQTFSLDPPQPGKSRLRLMKDDGGKTYQNLHKGVMAFADGCYSAIRNPTSHVVQDELPEDHSLEQLAAFSVLARWVDAADLAVAS